MKRATLAAAVVGILVASGFWWFSPTQVIKRQTKSLLDILTIEKSSGKVSRQMGTQSLSQFLAPQVELETPTIEESNGTFERADVESAFAWLCNQAKQTHFKLTELQSITTSGNQAQVRLKLDGLVELPTYRPVDGNFFVTFNWLKTAEGWQLTYAKWEQTPYYFKN